MPRGDRPIWDLGLRVTASGIMIICNYLAPIVFGWLSLVFRCRCKFRVCVRFSDTQSCQSAPDNKLQRPPPPPPRFRQTPSWYPLTGILLCFFFCRRITRGFGEVCLLPPPPAIVRCFEEADVMKRAADVRRALGMLWC